MLPLVSAVLLTVPERAVMCQSALAQLHGQSYPYVQILILPGPELIGRKRNRASADARGEILIHWDDDDWHAPDRIERQVRALLEYPEAAVCGTSVYFAWDAGGRYACEQRDRLGVLCGSLCYRRSAWVEQPFDEVERSGEANAFKRHFASQTIDLLDALLTVAVRHGGNATGSCPVYGERREEVTRTVLALPWCRTQLAKPAGHAGDSYPGLDR
jgi:hypothetical protein